MQIMLDTAVDSPAVIYKFAVMLAAMFETTPAVGGDASINSDATDKEPIILHDIPAATGAGLDKVAAIPAAPERPALHLVPTFTPAPPAPPGPVPVEVDGHGTVYDPAVHSSSKKLTIDGRWKARRNVGGKDEAPAAPLVTAGTTPPPPPPPPPAPLGAGVPVPLSTPLPPPAPVPPAPLTPPPPPPDDEDDSTPPDVSGMDFPSFITHVTTGMSNGSLTQKRIDEVLTAHKIESLFALNSRADLIGSVSAAFGFPQ